MALSFYWLLHKVGLFADQRLQITKMNWMYLTSHSQIYDDKLKALFDHQVAGQQVRVKKLATTVDSAGRIFNYTQANVYTAMRTGETKRAAWKTAFDADEHSHHRITEEQCRDRMLLIAQCSLTLQMALRDGVGEPRVETSVGAVRLLWEHELGSQSTLDHVHIADKH